MSLLEGLTADSPVPGKKEIPVSRVGVVETIYHIQVNEQPTSVETRYGRILKTDEQPFTRRFKVGPEWIPLPSGWLAEASLLLLSNEGAAEPVRGNPTPEQAAQAAAMVVDVAFNPCVEKLDSVPALLIPPGESMRVIPADLKTIRLRCLTGLVKCVLTLFPM